MPWYTAEQLGYTPEQINQKCEELWAEAQERIGMCPDCAVSIDEMHDDNCDVARCTLCGGQRLSCQCTEGASDIWDGLWPGTRECYERKFIAYMDIWSFDYNRLSLPDFLSPDSLIM